MNLLVGFKGNTCYIWVEEGNGSSRSTRLQRIATRWVVPAANAAVNPPGKLLEQSIHGERFHTADDFNMDPS
jgi:hypothetical protein